MKYNDGDVVRVKSIEELKKITKLFGTNFLVYNGSKRVFNIEGMSKYCDKYLKIKKVCSDFYILEGNTYSWEDWMIVSNRLELE